MKEIESNVMEHKKCSTCKGTGKLLDIRITINEDGILWDNPLTQLVHYPCFNCEGTGKTWELKEEYLELFLRKK